MKEKILVLVYPGLGKTYTAEHFANVIDFEQQFYTYVYDDSIKHLPLEEIKSSYSKKIPNPDFPGNYIKDIGKALENNEIVVTTFIPKTFQALINDANYEDTRIILVIPDKNNFEELADRFRARGNTEEFIEHRRIDLPKVIEQFDNAQNVEKVVVSGGGYLSDALLDHGVKLEPGKGLKNYL